MVVALVKNHEAVTAGVADDKAKKGITRADLQTIATPGESGVALQAPGPHDGALVPFG